MYTDRLRVLLKFGGPVYRITLPFKNLLESAPANITPSKEPWREAMGRIVRYYVKIYEEGLANEQFDRYVTFVFDNNERLKELHSNIDK
jgi:hypothetical protein